MTRLVKIVSGPNEMWVQPSTVEIIYAKDATVFVKTHDFNYSITCDDDAAAANAVATIADNINREIIRRGADF